jgi:hypothetical protein
LLAARPFPAPTLTAQDQGHRREGPVPVRFSEGTVHGFLELRTDDDSLLAHGDLLQIPGDSGLESRMVFHLADGSLFDETTHFTQHQVFRLSYYRLIQTGPAFAVDLDAQLWADGRYEVKTTDHKDGKRDSYEGRLELPEDVSNGMPVILAKNLKPGDSATVHLVAFTPTPRLIGLQIGFAGTDSVRLGPRGEAVAHFVLKPQLGALTKFFAKLLGKLPPDSHLWIVTDRVPAFIRFRGPLYSGPVWRLSLTTPTWPGADRKRSE